MSRLQYDLIHCSLSLTLYHNIPHFSAAQLLHILREHADFFGFSKIFPSGNIHHSSFTKKNTFSWLSELTNWLFPVLLNFQKKSITYLGWIGWNIYCVNIRYIKPLFVWRRKHDEVQRKRALCHTMRALWTPPSPNAANLVKNRSIISYLLFSLLPAPRTNKTILVVNFLFCFPPAYTGDALLLFHCIATFFVS